jgi:hypothetical protein
VNEVGGRTKGTNIIKFIKTKNTLNNQMKDVIYDQFMCMVHPKKAAQNGTWFTVGGDKINHPREVATTTAEMLVTKLLFNSIALTPGAKFILIDISNFYSMTLLKRP